MANSGNEHCFEVMIRKLSLRVFLIVLKTTSKVKQEQTQDKTAEANKAQDTCCRIFMGGQIYCASKTMYGLFAFEIV